MEIASLVLGVFPVVTKGLGFFVESASKVKELRKHRGILKRLEREIRAEGIVYRNSWNRLLQLAGDGQGNTTMCTDHDLDAKLLASGVIEIESVTSIRDICEELNEILKEWAQKFQQYEKTKVSCQWRNFGHLAEI